ncbi:hypothetical protein [Sediminibacillus massiliensis]|uniref:hypothetical protein n=1 Tax=Sediminibacillus massiliensis TaxID=1926277 RepID=UPI0009886F0D|nr:hypothetical protein [Sediminibacillus massiliensis]
MIKWIALAAAFSGIGAVLAIQLVCNIAIVTQRKSLLTFKEYFALMAIGFSLIGIAYVLWQQISY